MLHTFVKAVHASPASPRIARGWQARGESLCAAGAWHQQGLPHAACSPVQQRPHS